MAAITGITGLGSHVEDAGTQASLVIGNGIGGSDPRIQAIITRIGVSGFNLPRGTRLSDYPAFRLSVLSQPEVAEILGGSRQAALMRAEQERQRAEALLQLAFWRDRGDGYTSISSAAYDGELVADNMITDANYSRSRFGLAGIPRDLHRHLEGLGFSGEHIMAAARDATALGFNPRDRQAMIDHATIRRYSINADGMNAGLQDFRGRLEGDQAYQDLARRLAAATSESERQALRAQLRARERIVQGESTLGPAINNPLEDERARRAAEGRRDAVIRSRRRELGIHQLMGDEAALSRSDQELEIGVPIDRTTHTTTIQGTATPQGDAALLAGGRGHQTTHAHADAALLARALVQTTEVHADAALLSGGPTPTGQADAEARRPERLALNTPTTGPGLS